MISEEIIDSLATETNLLDTLQLMSNGAFSINGWTFIAIIELIFIVFGAFTVAKNRRERNDNFIIQAKKKVLEESVDFDNIVNSAFHSSELYKTLIIKCHPDRFPDDDEKNAKALELFQLITKNKNDLKALESIKERAKIELGVSF